MRIIVSTAGDNSLTAFEYLAESGKPFEVSVHYSPCIDNLLNRAGL